VIQRLYLGNWDLSFRPEQANRIQVNRLIQQPASICQYVTARCALSFRIKPGGQLGQLATADTRCLPYSQPFLLATSYAFGRHALLAVRYGWWSFKHASTPRQLVNLRLFAKLEQGASRLESLVERTDQVARRQVLTRSFGQRDVLAGVANRLGELRLAEASGVPKTPDLVGEEFCCRSRLVVSSRSISCHSRLRTPGLRGANTRCS
jgi:hypothetical protein